MSSEKTSMVLGITVVVVSVFAFVGAMAFAIVSTVKMSRQDTKCHDLGGQQITTAGEYFCMKNEDVLNMKPLFRYQGF